MSITYIRVPAFNDEGDCCDMCIASGMHENDLSMRCRDLPPCEGVVFVRPEDLPEYHVRFIANRMENP